MTSTRPRNLLIGMSILIVAAAAVLTADSLSVGSRRPHAEEFQRLLGGLGLGPAVDLAGCPFCFDPRSSFSCKEDLGPLPGAKFYCRHHACSVFHYPPLRHLEQHTVSSKDGE